MIFQCQACPLSYQSMDASQYDHVSLSLASEMSPSRFSPMELKATNDLEDASCSQRLHRDMWPLDEVDPSKARFPCCIVWTPLPIVSWLAPFFGHVGICREDGAILDFSGSNFVNIDKFAFGSVARYLQLDREQIPLGNIMTRAGKQSPVQLETLDPNFRGPLELATLCCFPPNLAGHTCKHGYKHTEKGASISWDDALWLSMQHYQHKSYNLFTCNCHSFVANCLNRVSYGGSLGWNVVNLGALILWKGQWVDSMSVVRSFFPFVAVVCLGVWVAGWAFLVGWASFSLLLIGWFLLGSYCIKSLIECD